MAKKLEDDDGAAALGESEKNHESVIANTGARRARIRQGFAAVCEIDDDIARAMETYIKPLKKLRGKEWKSLQADTDIKAADLKPDYTKYRRAWVTRDFEEEGEAEKTLDDLKEVSLALTPGTESTDWIALWNGNVEDIIDTGDDGEDDAGDDDGKDDGPAEPETAGDPPPKKRGRPKKDAATVH